MATDFTRNRPARKGAARPAPLQGPPHGFVRISSGRALAAAETGGRLPRIRRWKL